MVSLRKLITQRRSELSTVESQLAQQQESISEGERRLGEQERVFLKETTPLPLTLGRQASLARIVGIGEVARAAKITKREKQKARRKTLPKFQEAKAEIKEARAGVKAASAALAPVRTEIREAEEFLRGRELGLSGRAGAVFALETEKEREGFRAGVSQMKAAKQRFELLQVGKPIFTERKLTGFEIEGQTVTLEQLPIKDLESLQTAGILTLPPPTQTFEPIQAVPDITETEAFRARFIGKKDPLFTFQVKVPEVFTVGVPFIKPSEREAGVVGFIPQVQTLQQLVNISTPVIQTAPRLPIISRLLGRTEEDIIATQRNILEGERLQRGLIGIREQLIEDPSQFIGQPGVEQVGRDITLTEEFFRGRFEPIPGTVTEARDFFEALPEFKRKKAGLASRLGAVERVAVLIPEFVGTLALSLGQQTFEEGELFPEDATFLQRLFGRQFRFGRGFTFTQQPALPTTTTFLEDPVQVVTEKLRSPALQTEIALVAGLSVAFGGGIVGGGIISRFRRVGFREGALEILAPLSPIRIKPGVFTAPITTASPVETIALRIQQDGVTKRFIVGLGKEDPFTVISTQQLRRGFGFGETIIETPATIITRGGTIISGDVTAGTGFIPFRPIPGQVVRLGTERGLFDLPGFKGGISESLTQQRFTIFEGEGTVLLDFKTPSTRFLRGRGAAAEVRTGEFTTRFAAGRREPIFRTDIFGRRIDLDKGEVVVTDFIRRPTDRFRFEPTITGTEIDLTALAARDAGVIRTGPGVRRTPLSRTFQETQVEKSLVQKGLSKQLESIRTSLGEFRAPQISTGLEGLPVIVGGAGLSTAELQRQARAGVIQPTLIEGTSGFQLTEQAVVPILRPALGLQQDQTELQRQVSVSLLSPALVSRERVDVRERLSQAQAQRQVLRSTFARQLPVEAIPTRTRLRLDFRFPKGLGAVELPSLPSLRPGFVDGFDTFVKSRGRFTKVNKIPQRLENALSLGADLVDNSTSRQFKVRKSGRIRKPKSINPFFEANRFKFREFKQTAKQRKRTPFNFIERTAFAIDTPNEVQGIPLKGVLEQQRRKARGIKTKRRKSRTRRTRLPGTGLTDL